MKLWWLTLRLALRLLLIAPFVAAAVLFWWRGWDAFARMAPNEWGDLLVGVFGPSTFATLGLAYLAQREELEMQRKELRNNTEALNLQRQEMATLAAESVAQSEILRVQGERAELQGRIAEWSVVRAELDAILAALFRSKVGYKRHERSQGSVFGTWRDIDLPPVEELATRVLRMMPSEIPSASNARDEWSGVGWDVSDCDGDVPQLLARFCEVFRTFVRRVPPGSGFLAADFFRGSLYGLIDARTAILIRSLFGPNAPAALPWEFRQTQMQDSADF